MSAPTKKDLRIAVSVMAKRKKKNVIFDKNVGGQ